MTVIVLNALEQELTQMVWLARDEYCRTKGMTDLMMSRQDHKTSKRNGVGAELAFCRVLNIYPDLTLEPQRADCFIRGKSVDVKTTTHLKGQLICMESKVTDPCDIYVLLICKYPKFKLVGWADRQMLQDPGRLVDWGYGPTYAIPQNELRPIQELLDTTSRTTTMGA